MTEPNPEASNGAAAVFLEDGSTDAEPGGTSGAEAGLEPGAESGTGPGAGPDAELGGESGGEDASGEEPAGMTRGIWWAAALLPFLAVAGAVLCFAAGVLNTGGCQPEGSALCSGGGEWFTFGLPLLVAPLTAAVTAIGAVVSRRHRSTWLAVGYFVVFVSALIGLASANSGSS